MTHRSLISTAARLCFALQLGALGCDSDDEKPTTPEPKPGQRMDASETPPKEPEKPSVFE